MKSQLEKQNEETNKAKDEVKKAEEKHQGKKDELIREIGNREEEIRLLNKLNQQMKEETRNLQCNQSPELETPLRIITTCEVETQYCDVEVGSNITDEGKDYDQESLDEESRKKIYQLEQKLEKARSEMKEKEKSCSEKSKEIKYLKEQVSEYRNRLENVLGENSMKEKEIFHMTESLDTLKRTNKELILQLEQDEIVEVGIKETRITSVIKRYSKS